MPKNVKKTKKVVKDETKKEQIRIDSEGQVYGMIDKSLGGCFFTVNCFDNRVRRCKNRKKRTKIEMYDIVIVSIREFSDLNGDIIHKYSQDDAKSLQREGHIPKMSSEKMERINSSNINNDECIFDFDAI